MRFIIMTAAAALLSTPTLASSTTNPFQDAFELCQEREVQSLEPEMEISPFPIEWDSGLWTIMWSSGEKTALLSTEPYVHIEEGLIPFAIRNGTKVTMIIPVPATESEDTWCDAVPVE